MAFDFGRHGREPSIRIAAGMDPKDSEQIFRASCSHRES
jgi:hypothetical protein